MTPTDQLHERYEPKTAVAITMWRWGAPAFIESIWRLRNTPGFPEAFEKETGVELKSANWRDNENQSR